MPAWATRAARTPQSGARRCPWVMLWALSAPVSGRVNSTLPQQLHHGGLVDMQRLPDQQPAVRRALRSYREPTEMSRWGVNGVRVECRVSNAEFKRDAVGLIRSLGWTLAEVALPPLHHRPGLRIRSRQPPGGPAVGEARARKNPALVAGATGEVLLGRRPLAAHESCTDSADDRPQPCRTTARQRPL